MLPSWALAPINNFSRILMARSQCSISRRQMIISLKLVSTKFRRLIASWACRKQVSHPWAIMWTSRVICLMLSILSRHEDSKYCHHTKKHLDRSCSAIKQLGMRLTGRNNFFKDLLHRRKAAVPARIHFVERRRQALIANCIVSLQQR